MNITDLTNTVNAVIAELSNVATNLKDDDRIKINELSERVGAKVNVDGNEIIGIVNFFVHNLDGFYTEQGRKGGFRRGSKNNI